MTKVIVTGGHHNAALVVAEILRARGVKVVWIGHRYAARGDRHDSAEYSEVTTHKFPFYDLSAGRFTLSLSELIRLPLGLFQSLTILSKERPDAVLSFGGYLGAAVSLAAWLKRIRIYLHEQTRTVGKANQLSGKLARRIYLTWPDSVTHFEAGKTRVVGLPLRQSILEASPNKPHSPNKPILLIMGGKQGAHVINVWVFNNLSSLCQHFVVVHQTGASEVTGDYAYARTQKAPGYQPVNYIAEQEIGKHLSSASLYLGRSGAHITYELGLLGLPAILVPLMSTHDHEQLKNAEFLVKSGQAVIVRQGELSLSKVLAASKILIKAKKLPLNLVRNAGVVLADDLIKDLRGT